MSTVTRPQLSVKNQYYIPKHRYYELKHFCLQYPEWKKYYTEKSFLNSKWFINPVKNVSCRPVEYAIEIQEYYKTRMELVEKAAFMTDATLCNYLLQGVTTGLSYEKLNARVQIPCCKDSYYILYRKFFFILDSLRK